VEDMKERYYSCLGKLAADLKMQPNCMERSYRYSMPGCSLLTQSEGVCRYDHEHETNRKQQLETIYSRTSAQVPPLQGVAARLDNSKGIPHRCTRRMNSRLNCDGSANARLNWYEDSSTFPLCFLPITFSRPPNLNF